LPYEIAVRFANSNKQMNKPCIAFVAAISRNGVIGRDGGLPWRLPSDLKHFKALTMGKPVIMGRKTWESLPRKPLPGRENVVITRQSDYRAEGAHVVKTIDDALQLAESFRPEEIAIIGGGEIYRSLFDRAGRLYLTEVDLDTEGDTYFPPINSRDWREIACERHEKGPHDSAGFTVRVFDRIKSQKLN
jgi:dihydrofolate reductase